MKHNSTLTLGLLTLAITSSVSAGYVIGFSNTDFATSPVFSNVTTFALSVDVDGSLQPGLVSDPGILDIQYSVSGSLSGTPSGFPAFAFNLVDLPSLSAPITGTDFYALNASSVAGGTLKYSISLSADLSDGLQLSELDELAIDVAAGIGAGVIFHFNGREVNSGRYHPMFLQLKSDGTGLLQNSNNTGGENPSSMQIVDVDFGEEYITNLTYTPSNVTVAVPEPTAALALGAIAFSLVLWRRKRI